MKLKTDFLVIGSGIAGLSFALNVAEQGKVLIVTKASADETNTRYAQGGIAAVMYNPDTYDKHIQDTIKAGAGLSDENIGLRVKPCSFCIVGYFYFRICEFLEFLNCLDVCSPHVRGRYNSKFSASLGENFKLIDY